MTNRVYRSVSFIKGPYAKEGFLTKPFDTTAKFDDGKAARAFFNKANANFVQGSQTICKVAWIKDMTTGRFV